MQILLLIKLFFFFTWNDLRRSERMWIASITQSGSNTYSGSSGFEALIHGCPVFQSGMANPLEHSYWFAFRAVLPSQVPYDFQVFLEFYIALSTIPCGCIWFAHWGSSICLLSFLLFGLDLPHIDETNMEWTGRKSDNRCIVGTSSNSTVWPHEGEHWNSLVLLLIIDPSFFHFLSSCMEPRLCTRWLIARESIFCRRYAWVYLEIWHVMLNQRRSWWKPRALFRWLWSSFLSMMLPVSLKLAGARADL